MSGLLYACGGGGGSNGGGSGGGGGSNGGGGSGGGTGNPCGTAIEPSADLAPVSAPDVVAAKSKPIDGSSRWNVLDALWTHRQESERRALAGLAPEPSTTGVNNADVGEIAVIQDEGDVILAPNSFDLRGAGVRFSRNSSSGYDTSRIDGNFRQTLGRQLTLGDDDTAQANVAFSFNFFGQTQTTAFVNSDGNITFGEGDKESTDRNIARLLTGPPRVSPFLADLDPSAGGRIFVNATASLYTVTWCSVRGFDSTQTITAQATLLPDGTIEMIYGSGASQLGDAVVGVSPGHTGQFRPVNLSDSGPTSGGNAAVGERFAASQQLDAVALTKKFYQTHPDNYDQLVVWTDSAIIQDAFAFETTVSNEIQGIGVDIYDASADFGSAGRLRSYAIMDWVGKYPDDPTAKFLGENNTLSVLGQEVGHRWLAFLEFRDHNGQRSQALLGRGLAHWSFFMDSDASVMEGNDIEDLGGGSFRTVAAVQRYSLLDQYAMGLVPPSQVPTFFYVESPTNVSPSRTATSAPQVGVTFNGTRRDVLIGDVTSVLGARVPASTDAPRLHRQAFLLLVSAGRSVDSSMVDKVDRIRRQWEPFFSGATDSRMRVQTTLR